MKKTLLIVALLALVALPVSAASKLATLINSDGQKIVVSAGSPLAQQLIDDGYWLMGGEVITPKLGGVASGLFDVVGSKIGTSTTAVGFYGSQSANGTSTYSTFIGQGVDTATFTIQAKTASSSSSSVGWKIWGSNDGTCATTLTTASSTQNTGLSITKSQINWFDLNADNSRSSGWFVPNWAGNASSTAVTLTNLNWGCLKLDLTGSSTSLWVQLQTRNQFIK